MTPDIDFRNPLLWAMILGWVLSVTLHEFAHGLVAWLGGDYTIRERGGLTLNPLQYVDPLMSIVLPVVFILMGGIALPGGATFVNTDLLRGRRWISATYAAGPAMNGLLFLLLCIPLNPSVGWIDYSVRPDQWTTAQVFVATAAYLQIFSVLLNLVPIPGLDGFGIISPFLPHDLRMRLTTPPWSTILFFGYFLMIWRSPVFSQALFEAMAAIFSFMHIHFGFVYQAFELSWRGSLSF